MLVELLEQLLEAIEHGVDCSLVAGEIAPDERLEGFSVTILEAHGYPGGMVGGAIPEYRLPSSVMEQDLATLEALGVTIHFNTAAGRDIHLSQLRRNGFRQVIITVGSQIGKKLGLEGEDCDGVMDALYFLRHSREGRPVPTGNRIGVIGAGDTAMDCARTAWRRSADQTAGPSGSQTGSKVSMI